MINQNESNLQNPPLLAKDHSLLYDLLHLPCLLLDRLSCHLLPGKQQIQIQNTKCEWKYKKTISFWIVSLVIVFQLKQCPAHYLHDLLHAFKDISK